MTNPHGWVLTETSSTSQVQPEIKKKEKKKKYEPTITEEEVKTWVQTSSDWDQTSFLDKQNAFLFNPSEFNL